MPDNRPQFKTINSTPALKPNTTSAFKNPPLQGNANLNNPTPEEKIARTVTTITPQNITKTKQDFTKAASRAIPTQQQKPHYDSHALNHTKDDSYWVSLFTILSIPILLLYALFEVITKATPWPTGPS